METYTLYRNEFCTRCKIDSVQAFYGFDNRFNNGLITKCTICDEIFYLSLENRAFTSRLTGDKMTLDQVLDVIWEEDNEKVK